YHLGYDERILDRLPALAPRIGIVHLGDARCPPQGEQNRCRMGEGALPLRQIVAALSDAGYDGYLEVELMGEEIEACDYHELLAQSKAAYLDMVGAPRT